MDSRLRRRHALAAIAAAMLVPTLLMACSGGPAGTAGTTGTTVSATPTTPGPSAWASPSAPPMIPGPVPPAAALAAEGGSPVVGQLGTYVWRETGSDAPWLPGTPMTVGAGEPLTVVTDPAVPIAAWSARVVPAATGGPDGATSLGTGVSAPAFAAPGPGAWTIDVELRFADGLGDAHYFWAVTVPP